MSSTPRQSDGGSAFTSFYSIIPHGLVAFCRTSILELRVVPILNVAPLGVSVLPLHASLSTCNLDTLLSVMLE